MTIQRCFLALTVIVLGAGCSMFDDEGKLELRTDKTGYEPGDDITITAKNGTDEVIYYSTCMETWLEELKDRKVADRVGFPVCACVCMAQLNPGEEWTYELDVTWLWQNAGVSQPKIGPDYRFNLVTFFKGDQVRRQLSPRELRTNEFRFIPHVAN